METEFREIYRKCEGLHLQSLERLYALYQAGRYLLNNPVEGAIVECGVFKGASIILLAELFKNASQCEKEIFLYDTFEGWPAQTAQDKRFSQKPLTKQTAWGQSAPDLASVRKNVEATGYPKEKFVFVKGKVEETIPASVPEKISLLRLDTDGYDSTRHELIHLYPLLSEGGILIIDDYGHWEGAKKAVDEYFTEKKITMLLNHIDYTGRIGIKPRSR